MSTNAIYPPLKSLLIFTFIALAVGACTPEPPAIDCPKGTKLDKAANACAPSVADIKCDKGFDFKKGVGCVPKVEDGCPEGTSFKKGEGCVAKLDRDCPKGMHFAKGEGCVADQEKDCPKGMRFVKGEGCVPEKDAKCDKGMTFVKGKGCVANADTSCPKGQTFVKGKGCVTKALKLSLKGSLKGGDGLGGQIILSLRGTELQGNAKGMRNSEKWNSGFNGIICGDRFFAAGNNKNTFVQVQGTIKGKRATGTISGLFNGKSSSGNFTVSAF